MKKLPPMHSWDQMKPRTVYEKAVQDFTETARRLARLNQHFRQASFAEFEMLMVDDEVLKRYGLPKPMVERALIKVYQTVVLDQQRYGAAGIGQTKPSEKVACNRPWENLPLRDRFGSSAAQSCIARPQRPASACIVRSTDAGERDRRKTRSH